MLLPPVRRSFSRDASLAASFTGGAIIGALAITPLLLLGVGLAYPLPLSVRIAVLAAFSVFAIAHTVWKGKSELPQNRRQIGSGVISSREPRGAFRFGMLMGTGMFTYLPSSAPHVVAAAAVLLLLGPPQLLALAVGFGLGRGLGLLFRTLSVDRGRFEDRFQILVQPLQRGLAAAAAVTLIAGAAI